MLGEGLPAEGTATPGRAAERRALDSTAATTTSSRRLGLDLDRVLNEERVKRQTVGENHVPDIVSAQRDVFHGDGVLALERHLDVLEMSVHLHVASRHCALANCSIFQFDHNGLVGQLHQKSDQLHGSKEFVSNSIEDSSFHNLA